MKVTGWTEWDDPRYVSSDEAGFVYFGLMRDAIIEEIAKRGYKFTGEYHQNGDYGVPVIDDKWRFEVTQRTWGYIMKAAYPNEIPSYIDWSWTPPNGEEMIVPRPEEYADGGGEK